MSTDSVKTDRAASPYTVELSQPLDQAGVQTVIAGLEAYNQPFIGRENYAPLTFLARDVDGRVVGGLVADLSYNWLHIAILWLEEGARGQGLGTRLMAAAEAEAARQGRTHVNVDTLDFQALEFYRKLGYELFGRLAPYGDGHERYYLRKALPAGEVAGSA